SPDEAIAAGHENQRRAAGAPVLGLVRPHGRRLLTMDHFEHAAISSPTGRAASGKSCAPTLRARKICAHVRRIGCASSVVFPGTLFGQSMLSSTTPGGPAQHPCPLPLIPRAPPAPLP